MKVRLDGVVVHGYVSHFTGPLELTRRTKALVWDDEVELTEDGAQEALSSQLTHSPQLSVNSVPLPRRTRSQSAATDFPPPVRRVSTESSRPVPFAAKFQRVHPGTTGVTVLEHLERLDAVEASLQRLGREGSVIEEEDEEEVDVAESSNRVGNVSSVVREETVAPTSPFSPPGSPLAPVPEIASSANSIAEEDLVAMSKSTSHVEVSGSSSHFRWSSQMRQNERGPNHDWMRGEEAAPAKRIVIVEVR
jgi:phosphatidylinositol 4-kinase type 2